MCVCVCLFSGSVLNSNPSVRCACAAAAVPGSACVLGCPAPAGSSPCNLAGWAGGRAQLRLQDLLRERRRQKQAERGEAGIMRASPRWAPGELR